MKKTNKKFIGGIIVILIIITAGVIIVNAQTDETNNNGTYKMQFFKKRGICLPEKLLSNETRIGPFCYNLTEEQKTELKNLIEILKESGANFSEIRKAIQEKLDEFGVFDEQLNNAIKETEKKLVILNREEELREQGYSWEEINQIIQDEFGFQVPIAGAHGIMFKHVDHDFKLHNGFHGCFNNK
ncbi:MAG: hypothetical protein ACQXXF_01665 [Thermoplasmatota archaeon]|jgi:DNA-binding transcriptional MerR regulator